jgi:beta-glucanase (GH16 family)
MGSACPLLAQVPVGYSLVWSDEFTGPPGSAPNPDNWAFQTGASGYGNQDLQIYTANLANAQIVADPNATDGSALAIIGQDPGGNNGQLGDYTSAMMQSLGLQSFQYGYVEARIVMPTAPGIHPTFWMMGTDINSDPWPGCGEMDIMENNGAAANQSLNFGSIHGPNYTGADYGTTYPLPGGQLFDTAYHTFAILWQPNSVQYEVDGNAYETFTPSNIGPNTWVFNNPFYFLFSMEIGGTWPGAPTASTSFPQTMLVDYVRVYQQNTPTPTGVWNTPTITPSPTPTITPTPTFTPGGLDCPATMIDDFENQALNGVSPARTNLWGGTWYSYASSAAISVVYNSPGAGGTNYAASVTGTCSANGYSGWQTNLFSSGAAFNAPAQGLDRFEFWFKGDGNVYRFNVLTQAVTDNDPYGEDFLPPAGVWTFYQVPFNTLARQGYGTQTGLPTHPTGSDIKGIGFSYAQTPATYAFSVDQIAFACNQPTPTVTLSPTMTLSPTPTLTPTITSTTYITYTPTVTFTPTVTNSPTVTLSPTFTLTPSVTGVTIGLPYPNPAKGNGPAPLSFQVQAPLGSSVEWSVFSVSYRKVLDISQPLPGNGTTLVWNLRDASGNPVSNGLYYLRVKVTGPVKTTQILKVIVTR